MEVEQTIREARVGSFRIDFQFRREVIGKGVDRRPDRKMTARKWKRLMEARKVKWGKSNLHERAERELAGGR